MEELMEYFCRLGATKRKLESGTLHVVVSGALSVLISR